MTLLSERSSHVAVTLAERSSRLARPRRRDERRGFRAHLRAPRVQSQQHRSTKSLASYRSAYGRCKQPAIVSTRAIALYSAGQQFLALDCFRCSALGLAVQLRIRQFGTSQRRLCLRPREHRLRREGPCRLTGHNPPPANHPIRIGVDIPVRAMQLGEPRLFLKITKRRSLLARIQVPAKLKRSRMRETTPHRGWVEGMPRLPSPLAGPSQTMLLRRRRWECKLVFSFDPIENNCYLFRLGSSARIRVVNGRFHRSERTPNIRSMTSVSESYGVLLDALKLPLAPSLPPPGISQKHIC